MTILDNTSVWYKNLSLQDRDDYGSPVSLIILPPDNNHMHQDIDINKVFF